MFILGRVPSYLFLFSFPLCPLVFKDEVTDACKDCPSGWYGESKKSRFCYECALGTIQIGSGKTGCEECAAGKRGAKTKVECVDCLAGKFAVRTGSTECTLCANGKYQPDTSESKCKSCPKGYMRSDSTRGDGTKCDPCPSGQNSGEGAQTCSVPGVDFDIDPPVPTTLIEGQTSWLPRLLISSTKVPANVNMVPTCTGGLTFVEKTSRNTNTASQIGMSFLAHIDTEFLEVSYSGFRTFAPNCVFRIPLYNSTNVDWKATAGYNPHVYDDNGKISVYVVIDLSPHHNLAPSSSVYRDVRHIRARSILYEGKTTEFSLTSEEWVTVDECGDGYLQTHKENNVLQPLNVGEFACVVCPTGASCNGPVTFRGIMARSGFARVSWNSSIFVKCRNPDVCIGVADNKGGGPNSVYPIDMLQTEEERALLETTPDSNVESCALGHSNSSEICDDCQANWYKPLSKPTCEVCPDPSNNGLITSIAALLAVAYAGFMIYDALDGTYHIIVTDGSMPFHTISIRILSSYMQVTSLLNTFEIRLDDADISQSTVEGLGILSTIGKQALSFDCSASATRGIDLFLTKQTVAVTMPLLFVPLVSIVWAIIHAVKKFKSSKKDTDTATVASIYDKIIASLLVLYYLLFPTLVDRIAITFSCTQLGSKNRLTHSLAVR